MALPLGMRTAQGAASQTWTAPELQHPSPLAGIVDHHLRHSADHIYATTSAGRTISTREFLRASHRAGRYIAEKAQNHAMNRVVGILAEPEAFLVAATALGAIYAGFVPLMLSPRNSPAAIAELCRRTECRIVLSTRGPSPIAKLAKAAETELKIDELSFHLVDMPSFELVYPLFGRETASSPFEPLPVPEAISLDDKCIILHSSGSTSFPKPIPWTHRFAIRAMSWPWYGNKDICGRTWFVGASPTFHMAGMTNHIIIPLLTGVNLSLFDPEHKAWPPTPEVVIEVIKQTQPVDVSVVPSFLEAWAEDESAVAALAKCERVLWGGGPLSREVGDKLVSKGIVLSQIYGSTEIGVTNELLDEPTKEWMWMKTSSHVTTRLKPVEGDDTFVLQLLSTDRHEVAVRNIAGEDAYDTNDLVRVHPTDPNRLTVVGRADSQIMMANGEKTNPEPIEHTIETSPLVDKAVLFGRGRLSCGVLIQPAARAVDMLPDELIESIWTTIASANAHAPQHSRLFRDLVLVSDRQRPFELTAKNAVRRHNVLEAYAKDIEQAYVRLEGGDEPAQTNGHDVLAAVREAVKGIIQVQSLGDEDNLFEAGCDSLQAAFIHRRLSKLASDHKLPSNIVYLAPNISKLAGRLRGKTKSGIDASQQTWLDRLEHVRAIEAAIAEHTRDLPPARQPGKSLANGHTGHTILLTGTTGAFGSQLLASLLETPDVTRIYAFNRRNKDTSLTERQLSAFQMRSLDASLLKSEKLHLVEVDLAKPDFGVAAALLDTLRASVNVVIHSAWRVNFKFPLDGFAGDLRGLRHLIDFALSAVHRPHLVFASSIASLASWPTDRFGPERLPDHALLAVGQGYGESKYVGERMLEIVSQQTGLKTTVIRVGQLAGARSSGAWLTSEWFPALVKSSETLGCLPDGGDCVAWVPIDEAAVICQECALGPGAESFAVLNLAHPSPVDWTSIIQPLAASLGAQVVPYASWLERLEALAAESDTAMSANPALLLLDMFKHSCVAKEARAAQEALDMPRLETAQAQQISKTLRNLKPLTSADAQRYVENWRSIGFLARSGRKS